MGQRFESLNAQSLIFFLWSSHRITSLLRIGRNFNLVLAGMSMIQAGTSLPTFAQSEKNQNQFWLQRFWHLITRWYDTDPEIQQKAMSALLYWSGKTFLCIKATRISEYRIKIASLLHHIYFFCTERLLVHKLHHGLFTNAWQRRVRCRCSAAANPSKQPAGSPRNPQRQKCCFGFPQSLQLQNPGKQRRLSAIWQSQWITFNSRAKSTRPLNTQRIHSLQAP